MKLARVSFEHAMELEGSMVFPEGKTVVIYGENKAGKSNIIHALRYAFLSKVIRPRKNPGYDELKLVTTKEIAPAEGVGKISVEFEHEGKYFEIRREVDQHKDANKLLQTEATGPREIDFNSTITRELKAGLLDALFAPDSAMGFKHLNEKNIDAVIRELFKETGNAKVLAKDFKERVERLREEAQTKVSTIEKDYETFVSGLKSKLEELSIDVGNFASYEPGKTCDRINDVAERLKRH
ncbi:MAG: ATP-binding protein, partial [Chloroflexota bacterium]|nr:ATP-binding protein [Chloroflexota bacterium]